jgi:hypothetical protein
MTWSLITRRLATLVAGAFAAAGALTAGQKSMMHCFAFSEIAEATPDQWAAFKKSTDALPKTMKGIVLKVWHGKLRAPLNQFRTDGATSKKLAAGEKETTGPVSRMQRTYGVCMEMPNKPEILKEYAAAPAHKDWVSVYEKVRIAGTTTYDILGE